MRCDATRKANDKPMMTRYCHSDHSADKEKLSLTDAELRARQQH